jgi:aminocarboxymuconate-semialdehyde decarboxylase
MNVQTNVGGKPRRWPCAIDMHAHLMIPEMYRITGPHSMFVKSNTDPNMSEAAKQVVRDRDAFIESRMSDTTERLARMDAMGVDIQVLSSSLVHQVTYWAEPGESLRLERMINDRMAEVAGSNPARLIGLGGVPLAAPELAVGELKRCMGELRLAGVGISTTAGDMEIGDPRLRPFWAKCEELGAVVYIHPAGNTGPRFAKWYLWNSIGQAFEEAMAIASLFYEGILDAFPGLKICISHGGGYMPYYMGRIARNYVEKPATRANMRKSPAEYMRMLHFDSCVYEPEVLEALVRRVGAEQVVLGSDYPVGDPDPIGFVEKCALPAAEKEAIIGSNAARLFGEFVARGRRQVGRVRREAP